VIFYVDGFILGTSVAITAGAPTTVDNAVSLYVAGTSAVRSASNNYAATTFNRALSAAEVLSLYRHGIDYADKWGSQTAVRSDTAWTGAAGATPPTGWIDYSPSGNPTFTIVDLSGVANLTATTLQFEAAVDYCQIYINGLITIGKNYRQVVAYRYNKAGATSGTIVTGLIGGNLTHTGLAGDGIVVVLGGTATSNQIAIRVYAGDTLQLAYYYAYEIGATLALESEGIQPNPGQWLDSSSNKLHAWQPATGSSLTRYKKTFEIRGINTWAAAHEAQSVTMLTDASRAMLPTDCYITEIIGVIAGATIEDIIVGDGSDTDHWVAATTGLAAGTTSFTIANHISDGTNMEMVVDPDANFTGTIEWTIRGFIID
jgi:hypothetical protein